MFVALLGLRRDKCSILGRTHYPGAGYGRHDAHSESLTFTWLDACAFVAGACTTSPCECDSCTVCVCAPLVASHAAVAACACWAGRLVGVWDGGLRAERWVGGGRTGLGRSAVARLRREPGIALNSFGALLRLQRALAAALGLGPVAERPN